MLCLAKIFKQTQGIYLKILFFLNHTPKSTGLDKKNNLEVGFYTLNAF